MTYDELRLRGNPVAAFAVLRQEGPPLPRELSPGALAARAEELRLEEARRERVSGVRAARLTFRSDTEYFAALRRAQAGEETGGEE
jgi:hypothetical protein